MYYHAGWQLQNILKAKTIDYPNELTSFIAIDSDTGFSRRYKRQIISLSTSSHITSFLKHAIETSLSISTINCKHFSARSPLLKSITRRYAMNSRVSEPKNLHLNADVDVGVSQSAQSSFGTLQYVIQLLLANSDIEYFPLHAIQSLAKGLSQLRISSIPSLIIN